MNKDFVKNTKWIILGKIFQIILSLFVTMITARYLGPSNYGIITYTSSFVAFFTSIATLGINNIIVKELVDNKNSHNVILGTSILLRIFSSIISMIAIIIIVYIINPNDKVIILAAFLQSIGLVFQSFDMISYWYQSKLESKISTIIISTAFTIMTTYKIIILFLNKSVLWFAFSNTLDYIFIALFLYISYKKRTNKKLKFSYKYAKGILNSSHHFILSGIMVAVYGQMDKIMIGSMIDKTQVGYYSTAISICGMWTFILTAIIDSSRPLIMEFKNKNEKLYEKRLIQLYAVVIWISIFVSTGICIFAKPIVFILYGVDYSPAIAPVRIITWYTAFSYLGVAKNIWLISENKQRYEKNLCFIGVITNLILNILLIPFMGIIGAAIATLATQVVTNFLAPLFIKDIRSISKHMLKAFILEDIIDKSTIMTIIKRRKLYDV